jgi:hypothetical protein
MRNVFRKSSQSNLGALLNSFSEEGMNLALVGFFNVESGSMTVRTQRFSEATQYYSGAFSACDDCDSIEMNRLFFSNCDSCGRSPSNYFWIPSGDGDGIYPVFSLLSKNKKSGEVQVLGFAIAMFPTNDFAQPLVEHALEKASLSDSPREAFSFAPGLLDPHSELEAFEITRFSASDEPYPIYISDEKASEDSNFAIPFLLLENQDELTILAFSEKADSSNQGPKPRIIIGYSTSWLDGKSFQASLARPESRKIFDAWTIYGTVLCHSEPMHNVAIWFNFKINESMGLFNYAASWLLQGSFYGDPDCRTELDRYEGYTSDPGWLKDWLIQRIQYQAAADFEDGRLTFPFSQSNSENYKSEGNPTVEVSEIDASGANDFNDLMGDEQDDVELDGCQTEEWVEVIEAFVSGDDNEIQEIQDNYPRTFEAFVNLRECGLFEIWAEWSANLEFGKGEDETQYDFLRTRQYWHQFRDAEGEMGDEEETDFDWQRLSVQEEYLPSSDDDRYVFNIEGGVCAISGKAPQLSVVKHQDETESKLLIDTSGIKCQFHETPDECYSNKCEASLITIGSGLGDGYYRAVAFDNLLGDIECVMTYFSHNWEHVESKLIFGEGTIGTKDDGTLIGNLENHIPIYLGEIKSDGSLNFGDQWAWSEAGRGEDFKIVSISVPADEYLVLGWIEALSLDPNNVRVFNVGLYRNEMKTYYLNLMEEFPVMKTFADEHLDFARNFNML